MSTPNDFPTLSPSTTNTLTRISSTTKPSTSFTSPPTTPHRQPHRSNPTLLDASRPLPTDPTGTYAHRPNVSLAEAEMTQGLSPASSRDSAASTPDGGRLGRVITAESPEEEGGLGMARLRTREDDDGEIMGGSLSKCASGGAVRNLLEEFCRLDAQ